MQPDALAPGQPSLQGSGLADGDHDREGVVPPARVEMSPADEVLVVAPPGAHLVRRIADQAGRATTLDRLAVTDGRRGVTEHETPADVLALIVGALPSAAHVHDLRGDVRAFAVVGHGEGDVVGGSD